MAKRGFFADAFRTGKAHSWVLGLFLAALVLFGGSSRGDMSQVIALRPIAVLGIVYALLFITRDQLRVIRLPLTILLLLTSYVLLQLLPLPPSLWGMLPGQNSLIEIYEALERPLPWRPISLHTMHTWNSFVALAVPMAGLLLYAIQPASKNFNWPLIFTLIAALSLAFGLIQLVGDRAGLHLYRISNFGANTGFFANRNHQALLLAIGLVCLPMARFTIVSRRIAPFALNIGTISLFLFLTLGAFLTGSRTGLVLGVIGAAWSGYWVFRILQMPVRSELRRSRARLSISPKAQRVSFLVALVLLVAAAFASPQQVVIERLSDPSSSISEDKRLTIAENTIRMIGDYPIFGAGAGTFPAIYREYEDQGELTFRYVNHAHNDLLEVIYEIGIMAPILGLMLIIALVRSLRRSRPLLAEENLLVSSFALCIVMAAIASVVDYPLRTPILATFFIILLAEVIGRSRSRAVTDDRAKL